MPRTFDHFLNNSFPQRSYPSTFASEISPFSFSLNFLKKEIKSDITDHPVPWFAISAVTLNMSTWKLFIFNWNLAVQKDQ